MPAEPTTKRTIAFVDGQNLFYAAKKAFGCTYPNYDPDALARRVCALHGYRLDRVYFYTGVPDATDNAFGNHFWNAKLAVMGTRGIITFSRPLRYRQQTIDLSAGGTSTIRIGQEKGIDVRLALDVVRLAVENQYDVALVFSQDQDLSEAADDVKAISQQMKRWIKVACCFPFPNPAPTYSCRGINGTQWITIDKALYDTCLDPGDYRPKKKS